MIIYRFARRRVNICQPEYILTASKTTIIRVNVAQNRDEESTASIPSVVRFRNRPKLAAHEKRHGFLYIYIYINIRLDLDPSVVCLT